MELIFRFTVINVALEQSEMAGETNVLYSLHRIHHRHKQQGRDYVGFRKSENTELLPLLVPNEKMRFRFTQKTGQC